MKTWLSSVAQRLLAALSEGASLDGTSLEGTSGLRTLRANLAAARAQSYGEAARQFDEFEDADPADFSPDLPAQMPVDEGGADEEPAAGRWAHRGARPQRPVGRLVVPPEERLQLTRGTNPLVQFFLSLLPWATPPPPRRHHAD